jgi:hypothetical protein
MTLRYKARRNKQRGAAAAHFGKLELEFPIRSVQYNYYVTYKLITEDAEERRKEHKAATNAQ